MHNTVSWPLLFLISPALVLDHAYSFVSNHVESIMNLSDSQSTIHFFSYCKGLFLPQLHILGRLEQRRPQN